MKGDEKVVEDAFCRWLALWGGGRNDRLTSSTPWPRGLKGNACTARRKEAAATSAPDCDVLYGQLLRRMKDLNDPSIRFAAVIRDDPRSVRAVTRVPAEVRGVLKIDIYAVALDGRVRQL